MHVLSRKKLREFWSVHGAAEEPLQQWYVAAKHATWAKFADVRATYAAADQVNQFLVFNIGGNKFRLIAFIDYERGKVFVRNVLTHSEYDQGKWKADTFGQKQAKHPPKRPKKPDK
jgi:mRNA interferase HigB